MASQSLHAMHLSSPLGYLRRACSPLKRGLSGPFSNGYIRVTGSLKKADRVTAKPVHINKHICTCIFIVVLMYNYTYTHMNTEVKVTCVPLNISVRKRVVAFLSFTDRASNDVSATSFVTYSVSNGNHTYTYLYILYII